MPQPSTMCGGLKIFTSRPYALCHQSSNGAEAIIMIVPQMHTQAPSGPRNPQKRTDRERSSGDPRKVVCSTSHPQLRPETTAAICSSTCGGDQKVSRPIVRCHEMSQIKPTTMDIDAKST